MMKPNRARRRLLVARPLLAVAAVAFSLLFVEGAFRLFEHLSPAPTTLTREHRADYSKLREPNSEVLYRGMHLGEPVEFEALVKTNSLGLNDREPPDRERAPDEIRIALIGDSFVEAFQVEQERAVHQVLERALRSRGSSPVRVMAFGRSGTGQVSQFDLFRQAVEFQPDLVLFLMIPNDLWDNVPSLKRSRSDAHLVRDMVLLPVLRSRIETRLSPLAKILPRLGGLLSEKWFLVAQRRLHGEVEPELLYMGLSPEVYLHAPDRLPAIEHAYDRLARAMSLYQRAAETAGSSLTAVIGDGFARDLADLRVMSYGLPLALDEQRSRRRVRSILESRNIDFVDLHDTFSDHGSAKRFPVDGHWNELGHELAAHAVADHLLGERLGRLERGRVDWSRVNLPAVASRFSELESAQAPLLRPTPDRGKRLLEATRPFRDDEICVTGNPDYPSRKQSLLTSIILDRSPSSSGDVESAELRDRLTSGFRSSSDDPVPPVVLNEAGYQVSFETLRLVMHSEVPVSRVLLLSESRQPETRVDAVALMVPKNDGALELVDLETSFHLWQERGVFVHELRTAAPVTTAELLVQVGRAAYALQSGLLRLYVLAPPDRNGSSP